MAHEIILDANTYYIKNKIGVKLITIIMVMGLIGTVVNINEGLLTTVIIVNYKLQKRIYNNENL